MSLNALDDLFQSGAPGFFNRDTPVGSSVSGPIVSATSIQSTDYATKKAETWDDGRPKMLLAVTVASNLRTTPDDNGHRTIYIKTWGEQSKAVKLAFQNAYGPTALASQALATGNIFTATYTGEMQGDFGSPTKLYTYQIQPANPGVDAGFQPSAQQPPVQAPPVSPWGQQGPPPAWATQAPAAPAPAPLPAVPAQTPPVQAYPQPVAQPLPQAPAPVQAVPSPAVAASPAPVADPAGTARQLIALGIPDEQITAATGLDPAVIAQLRAA